MAKKLQILLMPGEAGSLKRVVIPKPLMVFGLCCVVLWVGIISYVVADYRSVKGPWNEFVRLERENAEQKETIRRMTEEIMQVAYDLEGLPEYEGQGEIGERLVEAYADVQNTPLERPSFAARDRYERYRAAAIGTAAVSVTSAAIGYWLW